MTAPYAASGGCSSCPHRGVCHESRQRIQDAEISVGRHYDCEFYRGIESSLKLAGAGRRALFPFRGSGI